MLTVLSLSFSFFFFNDTATTEIYTLSLHDALPIWLPIVGITRNRRATDSAWNSSLRSVLTCALAANRVVIDRKSTRLNSSHGYISYAVFCLKKKKLSPAPALFLYGLGRTH